MSKMLRKKLSREEETHVEQEAADEEVVLHAKMEVVRGRWGRHSTIALTQESVHARAAHAKHASVITILLSVITWLANRRLPRPGDQIHQCRHWLKTGLTTIWS
jgi:hypothetical protein